MEQKLFDTIISDIKNDSFFTEYKYKKSENMLYHREGNSTLFVELDHWQDYGECIIYIIYGRRFDILTKWFEKFSFKSLRDQRNNPDVMCDNTYFGQEEYGCQRGQGGGEHRFLYKQSKDFWRCYER